MQRVHLKSITNILEHCNLYPGCQSRLLRSLVPPPAPRLDSEERVSTLRGAKLIRRASRDNKHDDRASQNQWPTT